MRWVRPALLGCSAAASLAASLLVIGLLAASLPAEVEAQAGQCDMQILLDDIAKEIHKKTSKAAKKFLCPIPSTAVCSPAGCQLDIANGKGFPWSCKVEILEKDLGSKVARMRQEAAGKFGCSTTSAVHCAPDATGRWSCRERLTLLQKGARDAAAARAHPSGGCDERLLLDNLAEELHDELKKGCSFVTSVSCPTPAQWKRGANCVFSIGHEEVHLCSLAVQTEASREARSVLKKAGKSFGCPTDRPSFCTKDPGTEWLSCDFLAPGEDKPNDEL